MISLLAIASIISIGLMIGVELAVWAFINPILLKLDQSARAQAVPLFAKRLGAAMPFWYAGNFVLLGAAAISLRSQHAVWLVGAAAGIWAAVIVLSLLFLVPINNRLARPDGVFTLSEAHRQHLKWDAMHRARVVALGAAFALLLLGIGL